MNVEKEPRYCMQCSKEESKDNPIKCPLGPGWEICQQCQIREAEILFNFTKNRLRLYPEINLIMEGLYLGNEDAAMDEQTMKKHEISAVCVCGSYLMSPFEGKQVEGKFKQIKYVKYAIGDHYDQQIMHLFDDNSKWIRERLAEGRNVLVHCAAGVSRSASFTIAYLMRQKQMLYPDALRYVKERRNVICPNSGFKKQLQQYGLRLFEQKIGSKCVGQQKESHKLQKQEKNDQKNS